MKYPGLIVRALFQALFSDEIAPPECYVLTICHANSDFIEKNT